MRTGWLVTARWTQPRPQRIKPGTYYDPNDPAKTDFVLQAVECESASVAIETVKKRYCLRGLENQFQFQAFRVRLDDERASGVLVRQGASETLAVGAGGGTVSGG